MFYILDVYKMVAHDYSDEVITQCVARVWERKSSLSQLTKRSASEFLISRTKRANTGWEETKEGNLEQECKFNTNKIDLISLLCEKVTNKHVNDSFPRL